MKNFLISLSFIFRPAHWIRNTRYSKAWDKELNKMLDKPTFTEIGRHTVRLNGRLIWTSNYPYAYGSPYGWAEDVLPARNTVVRLKNMVEQATFATK